MDAPLVQAPDKGRNRLHCACTSLSLQKYAKSLPDRLDISDILANFAAEKRMWTDLAACNHNKKC